jgi:hypothetical protein
VCFDWFFFRADMMQRGCVPQGLKAVVLGQSDGYALNDRIFSTVVKLSPT